MEGKIAVFDSGVGGLTTLSEIFSLLPQEDYFYYADNLNAPYGQREGSDIERLCMSSFEQIMQTNPKCVVVACNTATSTCIGKLRQKYKNIAIIGTMPAIKPATLGTMQRVLVVATAATTKSQEFQHFCQQYKNLDILSLDDGAELAEQGVSQEEFFYYLQKQLRHKDINQYDSVVLGCTHFVLYKEAFLKAFKHCQLFDGNNGVARQVESVLSSSGKISKNIRRGGVEIKLTKPLPENYQKYIDIFTDIC